jgi:hypothetical protein
LHQVGARLTGSQLEALEERVEAEQSTIAAVVRRAVALYLENEEAAGGLDPGGFGVARKRNRSRRRGREGEA